MKNKKDILQLLEEVTTAAQICLAKKASLGNLVKKIEPELSKPRAHETHFTRAVQAKTELAQKVETLQAGHAQLTQNCKRQKPNSPKPYRLRPNSRKR